MRSISIGIAAVLLLSLLGCDDGKNAPGVDEILGLWRTSHAKYAGRYLRITRDSIAFGTGGQAFSGYSITRIRIQRQDEEILYVLSALNTEGQAYTFSLTRRESEYGILRLKNQSGVTWRRVGRS